MTKSSMVVLVALELFGLGCFNSTAMPTAPAGLLQAQQTEQPIIERVDIRGNRRLSESMIRFFIGSKAGEPFSKRQLGLDLQALYNTGFFEDIQIQERDGDKGKVVMLLMKEKPIILSVEYVGNKSFSESDILDAYLKKKQELPIAYSLYRLQMIKAAEGILKDLMIQHGKPQGTVHTEIEQLPPSSVRIRFILNEDEEMGR